ncbi:FAD-binding protein [Bifidobacterium sp. ESL0790]|uniref:FAD-binding protein n=1 Tax=Bifidobacterium sp. ESL0790 TaxID=2983233 RepID=UPI0023F62621|nr:FAD-binding protein [Bifidobacterium sp. ESL0790]WEV72170.1 FAD-binding protein [Bifidobacterium sp. ESL0790]
MGIEHINILDYYADGASGRAMPASTSVSSNAATSGESKALETPTLADLTTMGVGGRVAQFIEPTTEDEFIAAVRGADEAGKPLLVIGGGSNLLVSDEPFDGVVVRDARCGLWYEAHGHKPEGTPDDGIDGGGYVNVDAGVNWDDFVAFCSGRGFSELDPLSGIPGTVGASVVQNIGAYGREAGENVSSVTVWDRKDKVKRMLTRDQLHFGYRSSLLKSSMYQAPATPAAHYFPTPRYVVLSVLFVFKEFGFSDVVPITGQLAHALGVKEGTLTESQLVRQAILGIRSGKGMLEDVRRYEKPFMKGRKADRIIYEVVAGKVDQEHGGKMTMYDNSSPGMASMDGDGTGEIWADFRVPGDTYAEPNARLLRMEDAKPVDWDRHSCGSFFMNPIFTPEQAATLPEGAPRFEATQPNGEPGVKTSAAWLIDHAGFHKGFKVRPDASAGLSSRHTLALTNRGGAKASDIVELARAIQSGVERAYGIRLVPEPVVVGLDLR